MSIKDRTSDAIFSYYKKTKSLDKTLKTGRAMLKSSSSLPIIRGELCEAILIIMLSDYIREHKLKDKGWFISKGMILRDMDNLDSKYCTELDVTLFTPERIYLFECKSYKGPKKLEGECTLFTANDSLWTKRLDVYDQHIKHFKALNKYLDKFRLNRDSKKGPYKIVYFNFSEGSIIDNRDEKYKKRFPVMDETNLYNLFNKDSLPVHWDIDYVRKAVKLIDGSKKELTSVHLDYVKSLHGK